LGKTDTPALGCFTFTWALYDMSILFCMPMWLCRDHPYNCRSTIQMNAPSMSMTRFGACLLQLCVLLETLCFVLSNLAPLCENHDKNDMFNSSATSGTVLGFLAEPPLERLPPRFRISHFGQKNEKKKMTGKC
jgi:hypothetical protein